MTDFIMGMWTAAVLIFLGACIRDWFRKYVGRKGPPIVGPR